MQSIVPQILIKLPLARQCKGQTVVEYALLLLLIAIVAILMMKGVGEQSCTYYSKVNSAFQ